MARDKTSELVETIFNTARLLKAHMSYTGKLTHLSILQIQTLFFLSKHKNVPMNEIARYFGIELPSATSLLNKLYAHRLVTRHVDKTDRRLTRISLTAQGEKLLDEALCARRKKLKKVLSYLTGDEQEKLYDLVKTITRRFQKLNENLA